MFAARLKCFANLAELDKYSLQLHWTDWTFYTNFNINKTCNQNIIYENIYKIAQ